VVFARSGCSPSGTPAVDSNRMPWARAEQAQEHGDRTHQEARAPGFPRTTSQKTHDQSTGEGLDEKNHRPQDPPACRRGRLFCFQILQNTCLAASA
jgi:branched-subunit amino acid aminotransferase/4-amino-4-deoxychorismate lyase